MYRFILFALFILNITTTSLQAAETSHHVLVSVAPHKFFVDKIAGDTVTVGLMVPAGASSHTFEPTPKQMLVASTADLWFCIGESFEARASRSLIAHNPKLRLIDLRKNVDMITADPQSGCSCCHASSQDLHIWLSARQAKIQATTIAQTLSERYPEHTQRYQKALENFTKELDDLDSQLTQILRPIKGQTILVSHPAYAYFCRDYQLKQLSIEFEGKDPAPQQLNMILNIAREAHIKKVFTQMQYSNKGAKLFAKELNAAIVVLDPYAEDYLNTMLYIGQQFASQDTQSP